MGLILAGISRRDAADVLSLDAAAFGAMLARVAGELGAACPLFKLDRCPVRIAAGLAPPPEPDVPSSRGARLTDLDRAALAMVRARLSNRQIADALGVKLVTARWRVSRLLRLHGLRRRAELAALTAGPVCEPQREPA